MTFAVNNEAFVLHDGDIIFVNEAIPHETIIKKGTIGFLIQFSADTGMSEISRHLRRYIIFMGESCAVLKSGSKGNDEVRVSLERIILENKEKSSSYDKYIKACVQMIVAALYRDPFHLVSMPY